MWDVIIHGALSCIGECIGSAGVAYAIVLRHRQLDRREQERRRGEKTRKTSEARRVRKIVADKLKESSK